MSLSARLTFSQVGLFITILDYLIVRGAFVVLTYGLLWTSPGAFLAIALPLPAVIVMGFTACVISYAYTYLGLWMMDHDLYIPGAIIVFLAVLVAPAILAAYSWLAF